MRSAARRPGSTPNVAPDQSSLPTVATIPEFETIAYDESDGVATVTLNRPDVHNAFNSLM